jgi:hypothetical protein
MDGMLWTAPPKQDRAIYLMQFFGNDGTPETLISEWQIFKACAVANPQQQLWPLDASK